MLTIRELLEDERYKKYFLTPPPTPAVARHPGISPQWRVFLQRAEDGKWLKAEFVRYTDAFHFLKPKLKEFTRDDEGNFTTHHVYRDAAINNKRIQFDPPTRFVRIKGKYIIGSDKVKRQATKMVAWSPDRLLAAKDEVFHPWCPYCRRPTVLKWFRKHHAMQQVLTPSTLRCVICGASDRLTQIKDWYYT